MDFDCTHVSKSSLVLAIVLSMEFPLCNPPVGFVDTLPWEFGRVPCDWRVGDRWPRFCDWRVAPLNVKVAVLFDKYTIKIPSGLNDGIHLTHAIRSVQATPDCKVYRHFNEPTTYHLCFRPVPFHGKLIVNISVVNRRVAVHWFTGREIWSYTVLACHDFSVVDALICAKDRLYDDYPMSVNVEFVAYLLGKQWETEPQPLDEHSLLVRSTRAGKLRQAQLRGKFLKGFRKQLTRRAVDLSANALAPYMMWPTGAFRAKCKEHGVMLSGLV